MPNETLGASFSIDVTELKAGLAQANRLIRESESEFKAAAAGMDNWSESQEGLEARIKHLNKAQDLQQKKVEALKKQYKEAGYASDDMSAAAVKLRTDINKEQAALNKTEKELRDQIKALEELENASDDASEAVNKAGEAAKDAGDGFTITNGAIANLVAGGFSALLDGCKNAISSLFGLAEETREFREDIGKLETAFESAGKSTELAAKTYKEFYSVLGEEDRSVEAVNHLAKFVDTEQEMAKWTDIAAGVWGTFGDSLPIEGLTEASNETAKVGQLTGVLADALNWAGVNEEAFQASLDKCNTEQERARLITDTLNGLYSEAATHYRENNASIIEARKATSEYTDTMAEMGEKLEPVSTAITKLKTEFAEEFAPVLSEDVIPVVSDFIDEIKQDGTIKKFSKAVSAVAKSVLPPLGKAVQFCAENFETLVTVAGGAIVAFKTLKGAMAIANAITATKTAVAGLAAGTKVATVVQTGWNAALSANPIGAVLTAVGLLAGGIAILAAKSDLATEKTTYLNDAQRDAVIAAEEAANAYDETKRAAQELATAELANIDYTNRLWGELQSLTDANGKVKDGYADRAAFILGELNSALGTEYTMTGNVINQYKDMKTAIEDVILAKKAQILLEAHEESYRQAVENVAAAEQARALQAQNLAKAEDAHTLALENKEKKYNELKEKGISGNAILMDARYQQLSKEVRDTETALNDITVAYNDSNSKLNGYYSDIARYEQASTLITKGETEKAVEYLNNLSGGFQTAAGTAELSAEKQKSVLEQQVIDTEVNARLMKSAYENGVEGVTKEMVKTAREQADKAKEEFHKVGGDITKGIGEGAEEEKWTLSGAMSRVISSAVKAAKKAAGIESPSRLFKEEVGQFIGAGIADGVDESTVDVVRSAKNQIAKLRKAYNIGAISAQIATPALTNAGSTATANNGGGSAVNIYQTNNYSQAHSRYELFKSQKNTEAAVRLALQGG